MGHKAAATTFRRHQRHIRPDEKNKNETVTRYVTQLVCKHDVYYDPPPKDEDVVYCRRCCDYRGVSIVSAEWIIRDAVSGWTKRFGTDEFEARRSAVQHAMRYPTHAVRLWHGGQLVSVIQLPNQAISDMDFVTET